MISQNATSKSIESQQDNVLISQIVTSKPLERRGGTQKPPYAFTRNGTTCSNVPFGKSNLEVRPRDSEERIKSFFQKK